MIRKLLCLFYSILIAASMTVSVSAEEPVDADPEKEGFQYVHDPMEYHGAAPDIIENPDAVYGYVPNPSSIRLGKYVNRFDWTNPEEVAVGRAERQIYHNSIDELYAMIRDMKAANKTDEEIARAVSKRRNEIRIESYKDDAEGLAIMKQSNLAAYGNETGSTVEYLYDIYEDWETIIVMSLSANPGMDACLGFFDEYYDEYLLVDKIAEGFTVAVDTGVEPAPEYYTVRHGDSLWMLGVRYYDDGAKWKSISDLNRNVIADPALIYPGMILHMPSY